MIRDLSELGRDCIAVIKELYEACKNTETRTTQESAPNGEEESTLMQEQSHKLQDVLKLQGRWDAERVELNSRLYFY